MLGVGILHHQQLECFDGSEVTGKGNDSIAQKQNCVVEEIKEVKLRSRRGKFIYNRTYNSIPIPIPFAPLYMHAIIQFMVLITV